MPIAQKIILTISSALFALSLFSCEKEIIKVIEDLDPPVIIFEPYVEVSANSATIFWTTDEPCSVSVKYVVIEKTDTLTASGREYRQNHQIFLSNLSPNTTYRFFTLSYDVSGNFTSTNPNSFTTALDTNYFYSHGWDLYAAGDYTGACESFRQYLAYYPDDIAGLTALGWSQMQDSLIDSSITSFNTVLNLDNDYRDALAGLTVALYKKYYLYAMQIPAERLLALDSLYVFSHDKRYDQRVIRLMLADSYNMDGRLADAQQIIDLLYPSNGLAPDDSSTWKFSDGEETLTFDTYESALTSLIEYLKWIWWEPVGLPKPKINFYL
ncbi:MAG TPA: hypothetical protein P5268_07605 [Candidatus Marinimicrobia bacterium]|nr:hypothetical protein [Candidatus Neomarinimicrobiota bacterium]HRS52238.1 hypothetical protein [Candidatus Neomarinimicrobiota bacterium]HRU92880.1 hypothetical protein [Candidatus Neomarinimicrobiota bacterium]